MFLLWSFSTWANLSPLEGSDVRPSLLPSETYRIRCPLPPPFLHPKKPVLIFRRREALAGGINIFFGGGGWWVTGDGPGCGWVCLVDGVAHFSFTPPPPISTPRPAYPLNVFFVRLSRNRDGKQEERRKRMCSMYELMCAMEFLWIMYSFGAMFW